MTDEKKQAYTRRISSATRTQLITIVYDMMLDYTDEAKEALREKDDAKLRSALQHARACLDDLIRSLDMQYELSFGLRELYLFAKKQLILAEARHDGICMENAKRVVGRMREAWIQIEDTDDSFAAFDNAQTVYAGLTYGRGTLNESVADPQANRGLCV
ncbi:MAG: flagellar protein FliS [Lachnospiraceae bacterium]|nr:flagellar protein FliS [Lachnospiraceae bacterium]